MASGTAISLAVSDQPQTPGFAELIVNAKVELYACLQLLAERARFITGATWAAIALREGDEFIYRAASGSAGPEIGSVAGVRAAEVSHSNELRSGGKALIVTVIRESRTAGFFELTSGSFEFSDRDLQSIVRLSEMVVTALDHMEAAEHSEYVILSATAEPAKPEISLLWHAPEGATVNPIRESKPIRPDAAVVRTCQSCGFPVSQDRSICFDCEDRHGKASPAPGLFQTEKSESWISVHGYTIASIAVTAIVAAIIYWLR